MSLLCITVISLTLAGRVFCEKPTPASVTTGKTQMNLNVSTCNGHVSASAVYECMWSCTIWRQSGFTAQAYTTIGSL